jgi:hypothetical protein
MCLLDIPFPSHHNRTKPLLMTVLHATVRVPISDKVQIVQLVRSSECSFARLILNCRVGAVLHRDNCFVTAPSSVVGYAERMLKVTRLLVARLETGGTSRVLALSLLCLDVMRIAGFFGALAVRRHDARSGVEPAFEQGKHHRTVADDDCKERLSYRPLTGLRWLCRSDLFHESISTWLLKARMYTTEVSTYRH